MYINMPNHNFAANEKIDRDELFKALQEQIKQNKIDFHEDKLHQLTNAFFEGCAAENRTYIDYKEFQNHISTCPELVEGLSAR